MKLLAIETSCDETALALLECGSDLKSPACADVSTALYSQAKDHAAYGGVFPMLAKREHQKNLVPLLKKILTDIKTPQKSTEPSENYSQVLKNLRIIMSREQVLAEQFLEYVPTLEKPDIDAIAVTEGPGLEPTLWVGITFAKALSYLWNIPLVPVNHMEGHFLSVLAQEGDVRIHYPALALLVSGGHTELVYAPSEGAYTLVGQTRDDAVGEAFDKVARVLGLPYPGGPEISRLAKESRECGEEIPREFILPRPMIHDASFDFSYAGLKTAVLYLTRKIGELSDTDKRLIARSFEEAAIDVLISKTKRALNEHDAKTLIVGGGVVANEYLREEIQKLSHDFPTLTILLPTRDLSTDNAVMIGIAGYSHYAKNPEGFFAHQPEKDTLKAQGTLRISATR